MDLDGWKCTKYCLYKGEYQIFIYPDATYKIYQHIMDKNNLIAEIIGLSNAVYHVEHLIKEKENAPTL